MKPPDRYKAPDPEVFTSILEDLKVLCTNKPKRLCDYRGTLDQEMVESPSQQNYNIEPRIKKHYYPLGHNNGSRSRRKQNETHLSYG